MSVDRNCEKCPGILEDYWVRIEQSFGYAQVRLSDEHLTYLSIENLLERWLAQSSPFLRSRKLPLIIPSS
jgi:hypothetical protein